MDEAHGTDQSTAGLSAERIARNEAIFRSANQVIGDAAEAEEIVEPVPFVCECADPGCRQTFSMTVVDYRLIRRNPRAFWSVPGHEASSQGWAQVTEQHEGYVVVVKVGPAGDVAEQLEGDHDPASAIVDGDEPYVRDDKP